MDKYQKMRIKDFGMQPSKSLCNLIDKIYQDGFQDGHNEGVNDERKTPGEF